ncbi:MAG: hypothetical protein EAZ53_14770 [Bacteroidetes bacterium]|nr:MAG: hypothetical protein EAZ53_14770 [Bacteroidota bacterium]
MKLETYDLSSDNSSLVFSFLSIGSKGVIIKVIVYEYIKQNIYNLAFGDYDLLTKTISDTANSNNGDAKLVLSTVIKSLYLFFEKHKDSKVIVSGSSDIRTRLYQRIIKEYYSEFSTDFKLEAKLENENKFERIDFSKKYDQFRISKK